MQKSKVIVIGGPTASGKTALSIELAKQINGEIVSADSMQIYKDMNIGTAKPTKEEMSGIKHYLIDFVSPEERYSVADYKEDAKKAIKEIIEKGKTPIKNKWLQKGILKKKRKLKTYLINLNMVKSYLLKNFYSYKNMI